MEFARLKGFWKGSSTDDVINGSSRSSQMTYHNSNSNNSKGLNFQAPAQLESLEEIKPEVTSEGYGLRTPYGTHLNLDFVKYCEDIGQNFKRTSSLRKPNKQNQSTAIQEQEEAIQKKAAVPQSRLAGGPSSESLDSFASDGHQEMGKNGARAENTLMETRRRLEAFRSFRTKRNRSSGDTLNGPPIAQSGRNGTGFHRGRQSSVSSSSSGSMTPNSLSGLLNGNQVTPQQLQLVREQMASALIRLRELEEQVKNIPVLQVKISVLQQEKKHLLEEIKNLESKPQSQLEENSPEKSQEIKPTSPRKSKLSSTSNGTTSLSSASMQPPKSPQHSVPLRSSQLLRSTSEDTSTVQELPKRSPPPPPKRKYRSVAVGDSTPIDAVVCYSKLDGDSFASSNDLPKRKKAVDFSSTVKEFEIDAAFNVFPPPPKQYVEASTATDQPSLIHSSFQTASSLESTASTQTHHPGHKSVGCGDCTFHEMRDSSCDPVLTESRDVSLMVTPDITKTHEQCTSSHDLIRYHDASVGDHVDTMSISTSTLKHAYLAKSTMCDGLVQYCDAYVGPDKPILTNDSSCMTDKATNRNVSTSCSLPLSPPKETADKLTMTLPSGGRWVSYANMSSVSCGTDAEMAKDNRTVSTNTEKLMQIDQTTETVALSTAQKSTFVNIRKPVTHAQTSTEITLTSDCSTDCNDIQAELRHVATNTSQVAKTDFSSQYSPIKTRLVNSAMNTEAVHKNDAWTATECSDRSQNIDSYVDKVQTLLEEQQTLLAERYEVFEDEWDGKSEKVSRFVNPAFSNSANTEIESVPPQNLELSSTDSSSADSISAAISASLSMLSPKERTTSITSSEDGSDITEDSHPPLRPLPSLDSDVELKSIMRKPGTPVKEKFLRFAEGVKSDDDSSSEEEVTTEDDRDENTTKKEENDEVEKELAELGMEIEREKQEKNKQEKEKHCNRFGEKRKMEVPEERIFSYSNDFVKKTVKKEVPSEEEENLKTLSDDNIENVEPFNEKELRMPDEPVVAVPELTNLLPIADEESEVFEEGEAKYIFTAEVLDACDILEKHMRNPKAVDKDQLAYATSVVQQEWFRVAAQVNSSKNLLDDFVADLANTSLSVLRKVVNMTDASGNTVLHYAISHGNMVVVDKLLSIDELDVNKTNQAGYTACMLAALCDVNDEFESQVFKKLFSKSNVNTHAKEAGQTALMLAVSHGKTETGKLLLECGADVNARDQDGSTALMCAVEHGKLEAVKSLLSKTKCDATLADSDGSTALSIAMEAQHREIAILLYAQLNLKQTSMTGLPSS